MFFHIDIQFEISMYLFFFLYCCSPPCPIDQNLYMHPKERIKATRNCVWLSVVPGWIKDITLWHNAQISWFRFYSVRTSLLSGNQCQIRQWGFTQIRIFFIQITLIRLKICTLLWMSYASTRWVKTRKDVLILWRPKWRREGVRRKVTQTRPQEGRADAF